MTDPILITADDETLSFPVDGSSEPGASTFFVGVAKSGSTLMHMLVEDICRTRDYRLINVSDTCFKAGIPERKIPESVIPGMIDAHRATYYGFRCVGTLTRSEDYRLGTKVIMVRDPRDALTSLYFSMMKSHSMPKGGRTADIITEQREKAASQTIDDFICGGNGDFIIRALVEIAETAWLPHTNLYRYEDIIFNKEEWVKDFCRVAQFDLGTDLLKALMDKHDIRPDTENPDKHVRQVSPGNYQKHLGDAALAYIEEQAGSAMRAFGYA